MLTEQATQSRTDDRATANLSQFFSGRATNYQFFLEAFSRRSPLTFRTTFDNKPTREFLLKTVVVTAIGTATTFIEDGMGWNGMRISGIGAFSCVLWVD